jgi:hypothetical protein
VTPDRSLRLGSRGKGFVALGPLLLALALAACSPDASGLGPTLVRYERVWPDGRVEEQTIDTSGKVLMKHGDVLERLTLTADDVAIIEAALEDPIPTGSPEDSPRRTIELADGTEILAPRLDEGTVTKLLDNLMNTHRLT